MIVGTTVGDVSPGWQEHVVIDAGQMQLNGSKTSVLTWA
jgi:hypothetical protein